MCGVGVGGTFTSPTRFLIQDRTAVQKSTLGQVMVVDGETKLGQSPRFRVDFDRFHDLKDLPPPSTLASLSKASPRSTIDVQMCL